MSNKPTIGGSYPARRTSAIAIKSNESGSLMLYIPYCLVGEVQHEGTHSLCIGTKEGVLREAQLLDLREIFPAWTSSNPMDLQRIPLPEADEAEFRLAEYFDDSYTNRQGATIEKFSFKWINKLTAGLAPANNEEEAAILAKWGAKFEAVLGGGGKVAPAPVAPKAETQPAPAKTASRKSTAKTQPAAPANDLPESSAEAVYTAICEKYPNLSEDEKGELYFKIQDEAFPTKERDGNGNFKVDLTPKEWGMVMAKV